MIDSPYIAFVLDLLLRKHHMKKLLQLFTPVKKMFDFDHLHNELLNLDWTRIGWNHIGIVLIGCLGLYLFKLGLTLGFYQLYPDDEDATETDEKNTEKIATNEKDVKYDNEKKED